MRLCPRGRLPAEFQKQVLARYRSLLIWSPAAWLCIAASGVYGGASFYLLGRCAIALLPRLFRVMPAVMAVAILLLVGSAIMFAPGLVLLSYSTRRLYRQALLENHLCLGCGYSLAGNVSGVCPECGSTEGRMQKETEERRQNTEDRR